MAAKVNVCFVFELLLTEELISLKEAAEVIQNFYFINFILLLRLCISKK